MYIRDRKQYIFRYMEERKGAKTLAEIECCVEEFLKDALKEFSIKNPIVNILPGLSIKLVKKKKSTLRSVSYTHLRAHETSLHLVCRLLLEKKKNNPHTIQMNHSPLIEIYQYTKHL
eukprot:TRINITY_DN11234_c0_g1_i1.p2 TRINITY_DN11234_c0_g1~~TRINITY_DN11234_c0_g1_i1.p2  ORF type:complete len:117 (-),score=28.72 TRINITY_DN11234_c0_g1_i1:38-388(-)